MKDQQKARALLDDLDGPVPGRGLRVPRREERDGPWERGTVSLGERPFRGGHRADAVTAALPRPADTQL